MIAISNKIVLIVADSLGIGELPDAYKFNDQGSDTLGNIIKYVGKLDIPNLASLGIGHIDGISNSVPKHTEKIKGCFGKAAELFNGKDTTGGHWEIAGLILDKPFPVFLDGFPDSIIKRFREAIGREVLFNKPASGTEVIKLLGDEHVKTRKPIVYTSADSVFQIAMHEDVIPLDEQYEICRKARNLLTGDYMVARVIARPFTGSSGNYFRTKNRKDFSVEPPGKTVLDLLVEEGLFVAAVGKIEDIFAGKGITVSSHTANNDETIDEVIRFMQKDFDGLIFANLVDFDMLYGHRNDPIKYANAIEQFDRRIPEIMENLDDDDILIITADHGCDPTTPSTDHSREYVPILVYGNQCKRGINLGIRKTFADTASTIAEYFCLEWPAGNSYLGNIL